MRVISILLVVIATASASIAAPGVGSWYAIGDARAGVGTQAGALDSLDHSDSIATPSPYSLMLGSYRVKGVDRWDGNTGFYGCDLCAPLAPGQSKTWLVYMWAVQGAPDRDLGVSWAWNTQDHDPLVQGQLELIQKRAGVSGGPQIGTVWTTPPTNLLLPRYVSPDGLTGYEFRLTLSMVPEPSSLLALLAGLAGFAALIRRPR